MQILNMMDLFKRRYMFTSSEQILGLLCRDVRGSGRSIATSHLQDIAPSDLSRERDRVCNLVNDIWMNFGYLFGRKTIVSNISFAV